MYVCMYMFLKGPPVSKKFFSALWASVCSKNKVGGGGVPGSSPFFFNDRLTL